MTGKNPKSFFYRLLALSVVPALCFCACGKETSRIGSSVYIEPASSGADTAGAEADLPGISEEAFQLIDRTVLSDVAHGFPGAQLAVMKDGQIVYENAWGCINAYHPDGTPNADSAPVTTKTLFDLASVTKMFSVNYAVQKLVDEGKLRLDTRPADLFGAAFSESTLPYDWLEIDEKTMRTWKERITVRDLLCHEAGMPPDPRSFSQYMETAMQPHTKEEIKTSLFRVPLRHEPGTETLYSDLDYMLLGLIVEQVTGTDLNDYLRETFFQPLGLTHITYNPLQNGFSAKDIAATELNGNTRDGYVSHAGIRTYTLQGEVHDENAFHAMDGVSGHAGLFANARDLAVLSSLMLTGEYGGQHFFSRETIDLFTSPKNETDTEWGLGWWLARDGKRPGFFSPYASEGAIGHNGWTGTNVLIDPEEQMVIVYLTNRINSPVTDPEKDLERFDGSWYTSGSSAFVPGIVYTVGLDRVFLSTEALMKRLEDTVWNSFSLIPEKTDKAGPHASVKNAESKLALYRQYAEESGGTRYLKTADTLEKAWAEYVPGVDPADRFRFDDDVKNGNARPDLYMPLLKNRRVALFTNHTGIVYDASSGSEAHILDVLNGNGVDVTAVFAPEHGIRGEADAGEEIADETDPATGVPVYSLYRDGRTQMPSDDQMDMFDTLVIDIQDVGVRFYTYYLTMFDLMDACAAHGKRVVVLDRPNPNGFYVDGPLLREQFSSGVGRLPIPLVHGMTLGELAQMMNGEGWLRTGKNMLDLTVIPCENYTHAMKPVIPCAPSPNLKDMRAVYLYPSIALFENSVISVGRGTGEPFVVFGAPDLQYAEGYDDTFIPQSMQGAAAPVYENEICCGKRLRGLSYEELYAGHINLTYLTDAYHAIATVRPDSDFFGVPDGNGCYWIDYLCGTDRVRLMIEEGKSAEEIRTDWAEEIAQFQAQRASYLLYPE